MTQAYYIQKMHEDYIWKPEHSHKNWFGSKYYWRISTVRPKIKLQQQLHNSYQHNIVTCQVKDINLILIMNTILPFKHAQSALIRWWFFKGTQRSDYRFIYLYSFQIYSVFQELQDRVKGVRKRSSTRCIWEGKMRDCKRVKPHCVHAVRWEYFSLGRNQVQEFPTVLCIGHQ